MEGYAKCGGDIGSNKVWSNAVNTLLSAMESILLDEDLQPLWSREHHGHDAKRRNHAPLTPTLPSSHDPTFSPPLKRKKDPLPPSDRNTKSQRLTDHLTARLASSLHVSSSAGGSHYATPTNQTGLEGSRGFHRIQLGDGQPATPGSFDTGLNHSNHQMQLQQSQYQQQHPQQQQFHQRISSDAAPSEPRKYRKAVRNRSNPTTPVSSHPPSPGPFFQPNGDDIFSSGSPASSPFPGSSLAGKAYESFARNTTSSNIFPDPKRTGKASGLLMRRESRSSQQLLRGPAPPHLAMATRLALLHRIISTTKSVPAQMKDKDEWIMEQTPKRQFRDSQAFEAELAKHSQLLVEALKSFSDVFQQAVRHSFSQQQEFSIYNTIQRTVDAILENAQWLCGPEFEMGINRICSEWSTYERSIEKFVHYVQVIESMRETLSGRFQHPEDLAEDLTRSQEVIDYQRTLFGETLRNHGLEWRVLGLPPMEDLIQGTQDWILNMAKTLTVKIRAEVSLSLENTSGHRSATDSPGMDMMDDEDGTTMVGRPLADVMDLVIQGALLTESCLGLAGKQCPVLVTSWMELASQYCAYALAKRKDLVLKARKSSASASTKKLAASGHLFPSMQQIMDPADGRRQYHPSGVSRGVFLKTMELFENLSRLLQCVMEMREEEEHRGDGLGIEGEMFDDDDSSFLHGASAASSDQDDSMDIATPTSTTSHPFDPQFDQYNQPHQPASQQRSSRGGLHQLQRRMPIDPFSLQRWAAKESLAAVLVETGLDLCESMAETLGSEHVPTAFSPSLAISTPTPPSGISGGLAFGSNFSSTFRTSRTSMGLGTSSTSSGPPALLQGAPPLFSSMSSSARAAAAITSLTTFAGGGAMASGTGGIGLIYVQFVVRLLSKIIEFAGPDPHQEQRLVNLTRLLFKLANKYRPETRADNKRRRRAKKAAKAAEVAAAGGNATDENVSLEGKKKTKKNKDEAKTVDPVALAAYDEAANKKPCFLKYGMNHIAELTEKQRARWVVISDDSEPPEALIWLPALCRKNKFPYAIVKGSARLGTLVNKRSTTAVAFTEIREEDQLEFSQLVDAISAYYVKITRQPSRSAWMGGLLSFKAGVKVALRATVTANRLQQQQQQEQQQQQQGQQQHETPDS
ncbi:60S ribosomal protein L8B [Linnemannia elongata]|nr:60S ribosomal protein L8B [Linnemannia elongata]